MIAHFTANPLSYVTSLTIQFNDTSTGEPANRFWNFSDGTNSTMRNPVHAYEKAGTYNITLTAWNDLGCDTMEQPYCVTIRDQAT